MERKKGKPDYSLLAAVLALTVFGLITLYSTSCYNGQVRFGDPAHYFKKQTAAAILGMAAMIFFARLDYHRLQRYAWPAYGLSAALSGLVLIAGSSYNGSKRWLTLGPLSFQPAEYAKLAVILLLASMISKRQEKNREIHYQKKEFSLIAGVFAAVFPVTALVASNNLSTAVIILGIAVVLIFVEHSRYIPFIWVGLLGGGLIAVFLNMEQYRLERLTVWLHPEEHEKGFQTIQGLYAIGTGGLFGRGVGNGIQKLGFVPEPQNDMVFSIICEEWGFAGALLLILLFGWLIYRLLIAAMHAADLFGALLETGILAHIALQVILNIAVVTNTIPNTGITLPFVSYGGTSVLFLLSEMGLALSVSRWQKRERSI